MPSTWNTPLLAHPHPSCLSPTFFFTEQSSLTGCLTQTTSDTHLSSHYVTSWISFLASTMLFLTSSVYLLASWSSGFTFRKAKLLLKLSRRSGTMFTLILLTLSTVCSAWKCGNKQRLSVLNLLEQGISHRHLCFGKDSKAGREVRKLYSRQKGRL